MAEKISVRKSRRLRTLLAKLYKLPDPPDEAQWPLEPIVKAVLWEGVPASRARAAYEKVVEEFVDWNELRVTVTSEVARVLEACGLPGRKGAVLKRILGRAVETLFCLEFQQMTEWTRERRRKWFVGIEGVPHHMAAQVLYSVYRHDRVLVGPDIARVLRRLGLVGEAATPEEIEPALNAVIPAKEAHLIYDALWQHATTVCTLKDFDCRKCPLRQECLGGKTFIAEMEAAAKAAREAAKAARAAARTNAREAAKKEAEAKRKAAAEAKAAKANAVAKKKSDAKKAAAAKAKAKTAAKRKAAKAKAAAKKKATKKAKAVTKRAAPKKAVAKTNATTKKKAARKKQKK